MDSNSESVWYGAPPAPETISAPEPQHEDERHVRLRTLGIFCCSRLRWARCSRFFS